MKFNELHENIPYATGGKLKSLVFHPYENIELAMPGKHSKDTLPEGGDFVVRVCENGRDWSRHELSHTDIFKDVELRKASSFSNDRLMMEAYFKVILGADPNDMGMYGYGLLGNINRLTFLRAVQCFAIAEHRYSERFTTFRFCAGIDESLWTAADAASLQRKGRAGVERLEKEYGVPKLTQSLFSLGVDSEKMTMVGSA